MTSIDRTDSTINLTKAPIQSIYDSNLDDINDDNLNDNEIYETLTRTLSTIESNSGDNLGTSIKQHKRKRYQLIKFLFNLIVLSVLGILYNQLGSNLHDNHILTQNLASKPLNIGIKVTNEFFLSKLIQVLNIPSDSVYISKYIIYSIEGILFGSILPIVDHFLTIPNDKSIKSKVRTSTNSIIRSLIAFLGVSFALRKIEWNSSIQASIAWTLLNPCLWLLLDGSLSAFITSTIIASIASFSVLIFDDQLNLNSLLAKDDLDFIAIMLWLGNFFFFGLLIFGKIGRYLYR